MSKLTDEQMRDVLKNTNHMVRNSMYGAFWPELEQACRAIEAAACADRDARIAELEQRNRDLYEDVQRFKEYVLNEKDARLALERELERQLEEARKQRQPITEQELRDGRNTVTDDPEEQPEPWAFRMGVCFAERHHGIKDQP